MSGDTTATTIDGIATDTPPKRRAPAEADREVAAMVVAYCEEEPWRVGQVALFADVDTVAVFGRGRGDGTEVRVPLYEQRPTGKVMQPPLRASTLARRQLRFVPRPLPHQLCALEVQLLLGTDRQRELRINGRPCPGGLLVPGDTLELRGPTGTKLLFYCTMRPLEMRTRFPDATPWPPFGEADAFDTVGESWERWRLRDALIFAARAGFHVLVYGPSGAGKELAALALHRLSDRAAGPFVAFNAATFTSSLVNSELFGNVAGYPEARSTARPGLFGRAQGGTLLLDEIGELPHSLQANLLRATDTDPAYTPLGAKAERPCDLRFIGATNRRPSELKHDLLPRLKTEVPLPGLHERREDIPLLARHFVRRLAETKQDLAARFVFTDADGRKHVRMDGEFVDLLLRWPYTTHVRELEKLLLGAVAQSRGDSLEVHPALRVKWQEYLETRARAPGGASAEEQAMSPADEEKLLRLMCDGTHGSKAKAAKRLGKSRQQIDRLLRKHGIKVPARGKRAK